jgi:hypothetical protein
MLEHTHRPGNPPIAAADRPAHSAPDVAIDEPADLIALGGDSSR